MSATALLCVERIIAFRGSICALPAARAAIIRLGPLYRPNLHLRRQRAMDRTFVRDLQKPPALLRIERTAQRDGALDAVDHPFLGLAILAIGGVDSPMAKLDRHPLERQGLAPGIESKRHGRGGSQPRQHQGVGTRTAVEAAEAD